MSRYVRQYSLLRVRCGAASARGESSSSAPVIPARTIDEYILCPYRGILTARGLAGSYSPLLREISEEDAVEGVEGFLLMYNPQVDPALVATVKLEEGEVVVRGRPDAVLMPATRGLPPVPVVVEVTRTPVNSERDVAHVTPRLLLYTLAYTKCSGLASIPLLATSALDTRYHGLVPPPSRAAVLRRVLSRVLEGLKLDSGQPATRVGKHCAHCTYRPSCPAW